MSSEERKSMIAFSSLARGATKEVVDSCRGGLLGVDVKWLTPRYVRSVSLTGFPDKRVWAVNRIAEIVAEKFSPELMATDRFRAVISRELENMRVAVRNGIRSKPPATIAT
eukprot:Polyplicarium_translucidae@DN3553_c0_g1_i2.p3